MVIDFRPHRYRGGSGWVSRGLIFVSVGLMLVVPPTVDGFQVTAETCAGPTVSAEAAIGPSVGTEACAGPSVTSESES